MQKTMLLNVAAVAALTLLAGCGSNEEVKKEQDLAANEQVENVQVAENEAAPADITPDVAPADEATPADEPAAEAPAEDAAEEQKA